MIKALYHIDILTKIYLNDSHEQISIDKYNKNKQLSTRIKYRRFLKIDKNVEENFDKSINKY